MKNAHSASDCESMDKVEINQSVIYTVNWTPYGYHIVYINTYGRNILSSHDIFSAERVGH